MLNDDMIRRMQPPKNGKDLYRADADGLYIKITPKGRKLWYYLRRRPKPVKRKLGEYPHMLTYQARLARDALDRRLTATRDARDFRTLWERYADERLRHLSPATRVNYDRFVALSLPVLGGCDVALLTTSHISEVIAPLIQSGRVATAKRTVALLGRVFRFGALLGWCDKVITEPFRGNLPAHQVRHLSAMLQLDEVALLFRRIHGLPVGTLRTALLLFAHLFPRRRELLNAKWAEVNYSRRLWHIPAERTKKRRPHAVPLSPQALSLLQSLPQRGDYLFTPRGKADYNLDPHWREMLGYEPHRLTIHGFRASASSTLHNMGVSSVLIESQLAHVDRDVTRASYNRTDYLDRRRVMMGHWSDCIDSLIAGSPLPPLPTEIRG